jgi:uroporphyrinogen decarboxylase
MNSRERYRAVTHFRKPDRPFLSGFGIWPETATRWRQEGWDGTPLEELLPSDRVLGLPVPAGPCPPFEKEILEDTPETLVYVDHEGIIKKEFKGDKSWSSMPQFVKFPVENEEDFDRLARTRLAPNLDERLPKDWDKRVRELRERTEPLMYFMDRWGGFFGPLRNLTGVKRLCSAFYREPEFVKKMMDQRVEVMLAILERVLQDVELDAFGFWEDMAYKTGPLLAPDIFEEFMVPRYRKICEYLRSQGVDVIGVDSDGDVRSLIPLWLKAGLNAVWPMEVQAGMDVVEMRKNYGRRLVIFGGIDKRALARGKSQTEAEVDRVWPVVETGGYIPHTDHSIPPDVPWGTFCHYREYMAEKAGFP